MKLALVVGAFPKLSETFVVQQIESLLALGHDVRIFAFERSQEAVRHPVVDALGLLERTTYLDSPTRASSKLRAWGRRALRQKPELFDAIVCHFGHIAERARQLVEQGRLAGPLAAIFHAYDLTVWLHERPERSYAALFEHAALLLPISRFWRQRLLELGANDARIRVVHMGVDCKAFAYAPRAPEPSRPLELLSVGRLVEKKGMRYALEALARARHELPHGFRYHVVGDGPLRGELEALAESLGIASQVSFHGPLASPAVRELMSRVHALLTPSVTAADGDREGIPVVLMEAMAQGLPVLSTRHSGIPELVREGETGVLVDERDSAGLARALVQFVTATEPAALTARSERARSLIEAEFDTSKLARELCGYLSELHHGA